MINFYRYHTDQLNKQPIYSPLLMYIKHMNDDSAIGLDFSPLEGLIKRDIKLIINYIMHHRKSRWEEVEPIIKTCPLISAQYAKHTIGRWEEAESIIKDDAYAAYYYARWVMGGRWIEAEPIIMLMPYVAYRYALNVICGRWLEAEPYMQEQEMWWFTYRKDLGIC